MSTIILIIVLIDKTSIHAYYSALTKEIELSHKAAKSKVGDRVRITKHKNIFWKGSTKNWLKKFFLLTLCSKLISGSRKLKV